MSHDNSKNGKLSHDKLSRGKLLHDKLSHGKLPWNLDLNFLRF
jgi:hypothetical protein